MVLICHRLYYISEPLNLSSQRSILVDWDRRQRELEERLRNIWVRDDDLLKKVEMVLENQEKQAKLEQKMDEILVKLQSEGRIRLQNEEILKRMDQMERKIETFIDDISRTDATRSIENEKILDVVQTNLGWLDYFSEENENLEKKVARMSNTVSSKIDDMKKGIFKMHRELLEIFKTHGELRGKIDSISKDLDEFKQEKEKTQLTLSNLELEKEDSAREMRRTVAGIETRIVFMEESDLKCKNCEFDFSENFRLREDGVTLECSKCKCLNIVGKLKEGYKWMVTSGCNHFAQYPVEKKDEERGKCPICGKEGEIEHARLKCRYCHRVLSKNLPLREDGVSVDCPNFECTMTNIVGKLKEGHMWTESSFCDDHFHQFPLNKMIFDKLLPLFSICQICGKRVTFRDAERHEALLL